MFNKCLNSLIIMIILVTGLTGLSLASDKVVLNSGADFYNRYVWRGLDIGAAPSIQPTLSITYDGFDFGAWGAYSLSNDVSETDEIDFWLSYGIQTGNGPSINLIATDYYYPNAGRRFFNFNNYDAESPGAHTVELGLSIAGPEYFPVTFSGYINVHNDPGNNTYFQFDYSVNADDTELGFFCGFAGGSEENPDYYGTENLNAINIGVKAIREIKVSESYSLPITASLVINPRAEISHLLFGMSF